MRRYEAMTEYTEAEYYKKFQLHCCPRCISRKVNVQERTKGGMKYRIYSCGECKGIIRRETVK